MLTRWWDVYPKEGDSDYAKINLQTLRPVFTQEQLALSLRASYYSEPVLWAVGLMDIGQLHEDIISAQKEGLTLSHASWWTPSGVQVNSWNCIRSPSGVFLESIWTYLKVAAIAHHQRILVNSRYPPDRLLMDSIRMETFPGLLIQSLKTQAGLHI